MKLSLANNQRFKDVLFALAAADEHGERLGRLRLQKLIYLSDVLALAWRKIAKPAGFSPYKNGPYDPCIQNAVDALAFRGLVEVTRLSFRNARTTGSNYGLTEAGRLAVKNLVSIEPFSQDLRLFQEIANEVDRRGWKNIKALVYAEPTYDTARATHRSQRLRTDHPSTNLSMQILRSFESAFRIEGSEPLSQRNFVQLFFALLDEHAGLGEENDQEV